MITQRNGQIAIHVLQGYSARKVGGVFGVSGQWARMAAGHCCSKVAPDVYKEAETWRKGFKLALLRRHKFSLISLIKNSLEQHGGV